MLGTLPHAKMSAKSSGSALLVDVAAPEKWRPCEMAARPVVPLPANGSATRPPGTVKRFTSSAKTGSLCCQGWRVLSRSPGLAAITDQRSSISAVTTSDHHSRTWPTGGF
jgi:hypothetical protein